MTDPTPTPTAPDWRALCKELREAYAESQTIRYGPWAGIDYGPSSLLDRADAALATPPAAPLEPRGCPLPGACSCPTAPIVPPELIQALVWSEAALADIGDAEREPGDDLAWAERRAAQELPRIRQVLQTWRHHSTPPAATREAGPLPQAGLTDEQLLGLAAVAIDGYYSIAPGEFEPETGNAVEAYGSELIAFARAVLARWGGAAVQPVPVSDGWPEFSDCDDFERVYCFNPVLEHWKLNKINPSIHTHWLPHWALPVPAADKGEVQP